MVFLQQSGVNQDTQEGLFLKTPGGEAAQVALLISPL